MIVQANVAHSVRNKETIEMVVVHAPPTNPSATLRPTVALD